MTHTRPGTGRPAVTSDPIMTASRAGRHGSTAVRVGVIALLAGCSAAPTGATPAGFLGGATSSDGPTSALTGAGLGYDPLGRRVLAFGDVTTTRAGATTSTGVGAPTYAWTAATGWRLLHPTRSPGARSGALLAVSAGRLLMIDGAINGSSSTPCPSSSPSVSSDGSTVTQGCSSTGTVGSTRTPGDSWAWHGTSWQPARTRGLPPSGQAAVSDPALHGVVLVASTSHGNTVDLTRDIQGSWLLPDTGPRTWRLLSRTQPTGGQPAYDPHTRQLVAYTGNQAFIAGPGMGAPDRPGASSTSVLRAGRWVTLPGVSAEDADGVVATDPRTGRVLLYTELGHTFSWTGRGWHRQDTPGPTGTTGLPVLVADPADRLVLAVFTGARASTWTFTGVWHPATGPTP